MDAENEQSVDEALNEVMDEIIDEIFSESQENIIRYNVVDTGFMLRSGNINRKFLEKEIVYSAPYAAVEEFGREPGSMPSVEPIARWLMRKLHMPEKKAWGVAWAVAKKMEKRGTQARPFLRDSINNVIFKYGG